MFTFQSIMFVSLGFLCALLLGFVIAPAFWARAVRLTTNRIRASLPLTESEISAERDRLRAEIAIRVHQLTAKIEQSRLFEARQRVEINRRDGTISSLGRRLKAIESEREGSENARRVLEATITQRIPEVEGRLMEARQLLAKRDAEMKALQTDTAKTYRALDEAMQVNVQQRGEIDRLKIALAGHGMRIHSGADGQGGAAETETALRAELEKLKARSREQSAQIARLQRGERQGETADGVAVNGRLNSSAQNDDGDLIPLRAGKRQGQEQGFDALQRKIEAQAETIATLKAELSERSRQNGTDAATNGGSDAKSAEAVWKSRIAAAEKDLASKDKSLSLLRRELATANERIARQASHYQDELRRLGARATTKRSIRAEPDDGASNDVNGKAGPKVPRGRILPDAAKDIALVEGETAVAVVATEGLPDRSAAAAGGENEGKSAPLQSLEARLAAAGLPALTENGAGQDLDQQHEAEADRSPLEKPAPRGKLMDRIAGLAKR